VLERNRYLVTDTSSTAAPVYTGDEMSSSLDRRNRR
jgi:hypothetical protein